MRKTKGEVKAKEGEIAKLKERQAELVKAIEEMQDLVRKNESEASSATKSLSAMQAVSQASTDKLARLEAEIATKVDEIASQRRALDGAWAETNELKRTVAELRADRDDLRRQIGEGTSRVMETESSRRDIEQREAVLRATNKQLQDSLQRQVRRVTEAPDPLLNDPRSFPHASPPPSPCVSDPFFGRCKRRRCAKNGCARRAARCASAGRRR